MSRATSSRRRRAAFVARFRTAHEGRGAFDMDVGGGVSADAAAGSTTAAAAAGYPATLYHAVITEPAGITAQFPLRPASAANASPAANERPVPVELRRTLRAADGDGAAGFVSDAPLRFEVGPSARAHELTVSVKSFVVARAAVGPSAVPTLVTIDPQSGGRRADGVLVVALTTTADAAAGAAAGAPVPVAERLVYRSPAKRLRVELVGFVPAAGDNDATTTAADSAVTRDGESGGGGGSAAATRPTKRAALREQQRVTLRVVDAATAAPVAGANVLVAVVDDSVQQKIDKRERQPAAARAGAAGERGQGAARRGRLLRRRRQRR